MSNMGNRIRRNVIVFVITLAVMCNVVFADEAVCSDDRIASFIENVKEGDFPEFDISEAFLSEAYVLEPSEVLLIENYKKNGSLKNVISNEWDFVRIEVPYKNEQGNMCDISVKYQNGEYTELGRQVCNGTDDHVFKPSAAKKVFVGEKGEITGEPVYIKSFLYNVTMAVFEKEGVEYVVPYSGIECETAFESGKLYQADDFIEALDRVYDEQSLKESGENGYGGIPLRADTGNEYIEKLQERNTGSNGEILDVSKKTAKIKVNTMGKTDDNSDNNENSSRNLIILMPMLAVFTAFMIASILVYKKCKRTDR